MTQVTPWVSGTDGLEPRPLPQHDRSSGLYPWDRSPRWGLLSFLPGTSSQHPCFNGGLVWPLQRVVLRQRGGLGVRRVPAPEPRVILSTVNEEVRSQGFGLSSSPESRASRLTSERAYHAPLSEPLPGRAPALAATLSLGGQFLSHEYYVCSELHDTAVHYCI